MMTVPHWIFKKLTRPARPLATPRENRVVGMKPRSEDHTFETKRARGPSNATKPEVARDMGISSKN